MRVHQMLSDYILEALFFHNCMISSLAINIATETDEPK